MSRERHSIGSDVRVVDDFAPLRDLGLDARAELIGRIGDGSETQTLQALLDVGASDRLGDVAATALDNVPRRAGRGGATIPVSVSLSRSGTPASRVVGTSGNAAPRRALSTARPPQC